MKDTAAFTTTMTTRVTRQSWGTHTIWEQTQARSKKIKKIILIQLNKTGLFYLQKPVDCRERVKQDEQQKAVQANAGEHEGPFTKDKKK